MAEVDQATLDSLGAKLGSLNLTDDEQQLMDTLMQRAADYEPEVEGFSMFDYTGLKSGADLSPMSFKLGQSIGVISSPSVMDGKVIDDGGFRPPPP